MNKLSLSDSQWWRLLERVKRLNTNIVSKDSEDVLAGFKYIIHEYINIGQRQADDIRILVLKYLENKSLEDLVPRYGRDTTYVKGRITTARNQLNQSKYNKYFIYGLKGSMKIEQDMINNERKDFYNLPLIYLKAYIPTREFNSLARGILKIYSDKNKLVLGTVFSLSDKQLLSIRGLSVKSKDHIKEALVSIKQHYNIE